MNHQPEAQHPNLQLSTRSPADYPIFTPPKAAATATDWRVGLANKLNLCCASHPMISEPGDTLVVRVEKGDRQWNRQSSSAIAGHKTSVSLEDAFWRGLKEIAIGCNKTLSDLVAEIDTERQHGNLSSAIRLFVLDHYRAKTNGHAVESSGQTPLMVTPAAATSVLRPQ